METKKRPENGKGYRGMDEDDKPDDKHAFFRPRGQ